MDVGRSRHYYEGFMKKLTYQISINRGRTTKIYENSLLYSLFLLVKSFEEEIQLSVNHMDTVRG